MDFNRQVVTVEENATEPKSTAPLPGDHDYTLKEIPKGRTFDLEYDKLVIAVGCYSQTFNTPGVKENALFLKDVGDARSIRKRILDCFEKAALPTTPERVRRQLLHFAVVGGGPTGVEFSAELFDLCNEDLQRHYPSLIGYVRITIFDVAPTILSMFDKSLSEYALTHFRRDGIEIETSHHIEELRRGLPTVDHNPETESFKEEGYTLKTKEDGEIGVGMCVWSTGLMMNPFVRRLTQNEVPYPSNSILQQPKDKSNGNGNGKKRAILADPESATWTLKRHPNSGALVTDSKFRLCLTAQAGEGRSSSADESKAQTSQQTPAKDVHEKVKSDGVETPRVPTSIPGSQQANKRPEIQADGKQDLHKKIKSGGVKTPKVPTSIPGSEQANKKQVSCREMKDRQTSTGVQSPKVPTSIPWSENAIKKQEDREDSREDMHSKTKGTAVQIPKVPTSIPGSQKANKKDQESSEDVHDKIKSEGVETPNVPTSIPGSESANKKQTSEARKEQDGIPPDPITKQTAIGDQPAAQPQGEPAPEVTVTISNVFALGDVATHPTGPLPATAQVASQEAIWVATRLNKGDLDAPRTKGFHWRNLGMMAYLGGWRGIMQTGKGGGISGWLAWVIWRGAYLTKTISWRNKILIPIYWVINWVFGRDISRF